MARTPKTDSTETADTTPRRATRRQGTPHSQQEGTSHSSGKYSLAKGPLGIVLAALFLVEGVMGLIVRSGLSASTANFVIVSMVVLAFVVFAGFFYVWIRKPIGYLYDPSAFPDREHWLAATGVNAEDVRPSEPLLPTRKTLAAPASTEMEPGIGFRPGSTLERFTAQSQDTLIDLTDALQGGGVSSTLIMDLSRYLRQKSGWGYLSVNVDHAWLLSRLFIFVSLYRALGSLPCILFVTVDGTTEKALGIADPARVLSAIARVHTHFNTTFAQILTERNIPISMSGAVDEDDCIGILSDFVHRLQDWEDHSGDPEWSELYQGCWEHTRWLDPQMVYTDLAPALFDPKAAFFRPPEHISRNDLPFEIMRRDSPFVALIGEHGEFRELYDKQRIFEEVKNRLQSSTLA